MKHKKIPYLYSTVMLLLLTVLMLVSLHFYIEYASIGVTPPPVVWCLSGVSLLLLSYVGYTVFAAMFYRPVRRLSAAELPGCTIIVPAYNEGKGVANSLNSLLQSNYPADRLEVIAIDDGSKDDTFMWIRRTAEENPGRIRVMRMPRNSGKKAALCAGIRAARFDYIVTVDSDSVIGRNSLCAIISAFTSPKVGAVAGNIRVLNRQDGVIPCMMDIGFTYGFEIVRASQSLFQCVLCTPGALSAYRKEVLMRLLDRWHDQHFLGVPARIGEDRAIATMILASDYDIVFARNAVAWTEIPSSYPTFCRIMLRWTRSDIRENYLLLRWLLSQHRYSGRLLALWWHNTVQILNTLLPALVLPALLMTALFASRTALFTCLTAALGIGALTAEVPAVVYARRVSMTPSLWAFASSALNVFGLSWIPLYSVFTLRNTGWLTRAVKK